jgi:hypothetical protein
MKPTKYQYECLVRFSCSEKLFTFWHTFNHYPNKVTFFMIANENAMQCMQTYCKYSDPNNCAFIPYLMGYGVTEYQAWKNAAEKISMNR